ncbi:MAG: sulfatase-like hydrolase/transferase [Rhizobiales bacterium]|nr:sulfatase-like hydrolase/transferase [Hyphomicrobiales bacterium]
MLRRLRYDTFMTLVQNGTTRWIMLAARLVAIAGFVALTNPGVAQRVVLLQTQNRWATLAAFLAIWGLSLTALLIVALHRRLWVRAVWAAAIGAATAVGFAYLKASGTEFGIFDAISLWGARHEAARAVDFYSSEMTLLAIVAAGGFLVLAAPPAIRIIPVQRWLSRLAWTPVLPIVLIAAIGVAKEGGGTQGLPTQFVPLSVGLVTAAKIAASPVPQRQAIQWTPESPKVRHIVMLVDESVRADYIDWTPGNPFTPELAQLRPRLVDFGPAVSAGNCSHYSNALLRFAAAREHLGTGVLTNPTLWQYAKRAGYRTVFIDAQSAFNRNPGKLQNFMTADEARDIDRLVTMPANVPAPELDDRLLDIMMEELRSEQPVFIYANKNGAHFPYDASYPASERLLRPTMSDALRAATSEGVAHRTISTYVEAATERARINSYRNAVRWSVDRFFKRLFDEAALNDAVMFYTSDHGQAFNPDRLSHCTIEDPDPREGLVPLFVTASSPVLQKRFTAGAQASHGHASHFSLAPTLLELFGYAKRDIAGAYGPSLFERNAEPPGFTSGDIFGLFSSQVRWHPVDPTRSYLEPDADRAPQRNVSTVNAPGAALAR